MNINPNSKNEIQYTEEDGIKAIIALQAHIGRAETEEQARAGWRTLREWEKESTIRAYAHMQANTPSFKEFSDDVKEKGLGGWGTSCP